MIQLSLVRTAIAVLFFTALATSANAISPTSFDDFSIDNEGWFEGGASDDPPTHVATPGRDGVTPGHLQNISLGGGPGGRQLMLSDEADWLGDYTSAGVIGISMWIDNRSGIGSSLPMRIGFNGPGGWFFSESQPVADTIAGNEWTQLTFDLIPANFTHVAGTGGTTSFLDTLGNVSRFEIFASAGAPSFGISGNLLRGDNVMSDPRFDDITAIAVPEPATLMLAIMSVLGLSAMRRP